MKKSILKVIHESVKGLHDTGLLDKESMHMFNALCTKNKSSHVTAEIIEGLEAFKKHKEGKIILRTYEVKNKPAPDATPKIIRNTRENSI